MTPLVKIGYWRSDQHPEYPDPHDLVDDAWDRDEQTLTGSYLVSATMRRAYMGYSSCRICGATNGAMEYSDGTYAWPEGLHHYVQEHRVRLPQEFVIHACARYLEIDQADDSLEWWLSHTT